jgi:hypothetical protein
MTRSVKNILLHAVFNPKEFDEDNFLPLPFFNKFIQRRSRDTNPDGISCYETNLGHGRLIANVPQT